MKHAILLWLICISHVLASPLRLYSLLQEPSDQDIISPTNDQEWSGGSDSGRLIWSKLTPYYTVYDHEFKCATRCQTRQTGYSCVTSLLSVTLSVTIDFNVFISAGIDCHRL